MEDIVLNNITKAYNKSELKAVNDVSFKVNKGELFGLIGADGAGKTSIFRILSTLILPDSGTAYLGGCDVVTDYKIIRKTIGYMPGKFSLYQDLSVGENLHFFATVFHTRVTENYDLIKDIYVQLEPFKNRKAGQLSGGMKQKLALCCALIHRPKILLLDEPTTGVDVVSRQEFWEILKNLKTKGITVLVSTPYMDEAKLCERIALIQNGCIMTVDTPDNIVKHFPNKLYAVKAGNMGKLLNNLRANPLIKTCFSFGNVHHITFKNANENAEIHLLQELDSAKFKGVKIRQIEPSIEDCFIDLIR